MISQKSRVAVKEHKCAGCPKSIQPGDRYLEEVHSPWTRVADDVDDDGRTIYSALGTWERTRWHEKCYDNMMWGY